MPRFFVLLLLTTAPLLAQTPSPSSHRKTPAANDKSVDQAEAVQNRARQILNTELARKPGTACDGANLSSAEFGKCLDARAATTERNYRAFVQALQASLSIEPADVPVKGLPLPSKNFAAGEAAWRLYVDKTCEALGDTEYGASGVPTDTTACQQNLTRQHMRDLGGIFLDR